MEGRAADGEAHDRILRARHRDAEYSGCRAAPPSAEGRRRWRVDRLRYELAQWEPGQDSLLLSVESLDMESSCGVWLLAVRAADLGCADEGAWAERVLAPILRSLRFDEHCTGRRVLGHALVEEIAPRAPRERAPAPRARPGPPVRCRLLECATFVEPFVPEPCVCA